MWLLWKIKQLQKIFRNGIVSNLIFEIILIFSYYSKRTFLHVQIKGKSMEIKKKKNRLPLGWMNHKYQSLNTQLMLCAIWYHLHDLKNVKNTHGGVLL